MLFRSGCLFVLFMVSFAVQKLLSFIRSHLFIFVFISISLGGGSTSKKSTNNKCWRECGEKGTLLHYWWECKLVQPLWRTIWRFLKKLKIELPCDSAIPLLGIYPEKIIIQKESCTTMFIAALFIIPRA